MKNAISILAVGAGLLSCGAYDAVEETYSVEVQAQGQQSCPVTVYCPPPSGSGWYLHSTKNLCNGTIQCTWQKPGQFVWTTTNITVPPACPVCHPAPGPVNEFCHQSKAGTPWVCDD